VEESWPVRCVALGARRLFEEDVDLLRALAPDEWPLDDDTPLPIALQVIDVCDGCRSFMHVTRLMRML